MNQYYSTPAKSRKLNVSIESLFGQRRKTIFGIVQTIGQILFLGSRKAVRGFGEKARVSYSGIPDIEYSASWGAKWLTCSASSVRNYRQTLADLGYFQIETVGQATGATWSKESGKPLSPITRLVNIDFAGLAQLVRRLVVMYGLWDLIQVLPHKMGKCAQCVRELIGASMFSLDENEAESIEDADVPAEATQPANEVGFATFVDDVVVSAKDWTEDWLAPFEEGGGEEEEDWDFAVPI